MDLQLTDRVVLVAGASRGLGRAIAEALLEEGAKVALTARGPEALERTHAELAERHGADRLWRAAGDMCATPVIEDVVARIESDFGPLWGAVANVGLHPCPPGFDIDDATWSASFAQNLDSAYRLARAVLRPMTKRGEGALLLISSICGVQVIGSPLPYGVAKAGMNHMAKELARLCGAANIRVNALAPGNILFPGGDWEERIAQDPAFWDAWIAREVPLGRFGRLAEIGQPAAFFLSPVASFLTGAVVPVDGGQMR